MRVAAQLIEQRRDLVRVAVSLGRMAQRLKFLDFAQEPDGVAVRFSLLFSAQVEPAVERAALAEEGRDNGVLLLGLLAFALLALGIKLLFGFLEFFDLFSQLGL